LGAFAGEIMNWKDKEHEELARQIERNAARIRANAREIREIRENDLAGIREALAVIITDLKWIKRIFLIAMCAILGVGSHVALF